MLETFQQLERLLEVRRHREARQLLARAFQEAPDDATAHCYAARIALAEEDLEEAREHLERALAADPKDFQARLLWFTLLQEEKRWAEAEEVMLGLLREAPDDADLLALYARLMLFTLQLGKADALAAEALRREPGDAMARTVVVLLACARGERELARQQLADLVRNDPEGRQAAWTLFAVLVDERRFGEALRVGQELLRAEPDNPHLVDALVELRLATHPLGLPAYPMRRWGWAGSAAMWALGLGGIIVLRRVDETWAGVWILAYLAYVLYSWTYPPLMRRWLAWRGLG